MPSGLVSLVLLAAPQAGGPPGIEIGLVPVVRVTQAPAIDGQAEEAWSSAVKRRLERSKGPVPQSGDLQGSFRATWDDPALYLLIEVKDDRKRLSDPGRTWDDSVEVYVDGDGSRATRTTIPERLPVRRVRNGTDPPPADRGRNLDDRACDSPGEMRVRVPRRLAHALAGDPARHACARDARSASTSRSTTMTGGSGRQS